MKREKQGTVGRSAKPVRSPESAWDTLAAKAADSARAGRFLRELMQGEGRERLLAASEDLQRVVVQVLAGSQALCELLVRRPSLIELLDPDQLVHPRRAQGLRRDIDRWLEPLLAEQGYDKAWSELRSFKEKEMLRVAARDLNRFGLGESITLELSNLADACLQSAYRICWNLWTRRLGVPWHRLPDGRWEATPFCVLGMGKLGGQELNYSSDVDLLFVYAEEGHVSTTRPEGEGGRGSRGSNHQFFTRLAESFVAQVTRLAPEGSMYRIDMRLRPEGNAGPLVRSLPSYENYYAQWGQTWERMMLIKARGVAGDAALAGEFLEMVQPFRYPRSLSDRIIKEVAAIKHRIESEVVRSDELDRNVKLGRGGIREIEFVVQTLQVLNAGKQPFLQGAQTLPILEKLAEYRWLERTEAAKLRQAYLFLRDVEHRLQMENGLQTHSVPTDAASRLRLSRLMGAESWDAFEPLLKGHMSEVRRTYEGILRQEAPAAAASSLPMDLDESSAEWKQLLAQHAFRDPEKALRLIQHFVHGPGYVHVSPRTTELAWELLPKLLSFCPRTGSDGLRSFPEPVLSDPDRVLARVDSFIAAYGSRALLYETWTSNPSLFRLLLLLFDRSEFLAETAIRTPDLVDDLELSGRLRRCKTTEEILRDLRYGAEDEDQRLWIRRYHQAEFMRIGLRDILGLVDFEQNLSELSALAEACLVYALEVICRRHRLKTPPFAVIGLGKLGGRELIYGSDLDVILVSSARATALRRQHALAQELIELLSSPTELGIAYKLDLRLRPDGEKGLLVNTLAAHEDYYRERAQLWEIQSLTRARAVAGNPTVARGFESLATQLADFSNVSLPLAAYQTDWRAHIARMRHRIERERTPAGKGVLAFKTGAGGLIDAEFLAQIFCLEHGWREPNTLAALTRARVAGVLGADDGARLIEHYRQLRKIEGILRRWSFEGESLFPDDPAPQYRVAVRCGFRDAGSFLAAVRRCRESIRDVYQRVLGVDSPWA